MSDPYYLDCLHRRAEELHEDAVRDSIVRADGNSLMEIAAEKRHRELMTALNYLRRILEAQQP